MEPRDVETFLTLAEELHFGRAAERLHVSTAQISKTVKKLERQVGATLFERTSRKVTLTPIGRRLYEDIRPGYELVRAGFERAAAAGRNVTGTLRIGFVGAAAGQFVLAVAESFRARHPGCAVQIRESQFSDGAQLLREDGIDALFCARPVEEPDLTVGPVLVREDRLLAVSARHPFAGRASISFEDIARTTLLRSPEAVPDYWDASLAPEHTADGRPIERGPAFATIQEMLAMVGAGMGTYPVPAQARRFYARPDVAYVPIHDAAPFEWALVWSSTTENARIRAFSDAALTMTQTEHTMGAPDTG